MGQHTDISWADSTVNPTTGCDGCELWHRLHKGPCYAGVLHEGRLAKSLPDLYAADFAEVRLAPGRMAKAAAWPDLTGKPRPDKPWLDGMPRTIFVGDMGDVFSKGVPFAYMRDEVIETARSAKGRRHAWLILTKQASLALQFGVMTGDWPANVWQGVSVTSQKTVSRAHTVAMHPAPVKFMSIEPLLGPVAIQPSVLAAYSWVIVGGESGRGHRPCEVAWIESIADQCRTAGVPLFVKQDSGPRSGMRGRLSADLWATKGMPAVAPVGGAR